MKSPVSDGESFHCLHCGYELRGIGEYGKCPECGRRFDLAEHRDIRRSRHRERRWIRSTGLNYLIFGAALLVMGWVPLVAHIWNDQVGVRWLPLPACLTPPALLFIFIGFSLLLVWLLKRA